MADEVFDSAGKEPEVEIAGCDGSQAPGAAPGKRLSPAAIRALEEAAARRDDSDRHAADAEAGGPQGLEPTRFGDWERKGLAIDF